MQFTLKIRGDEPIEVRSSWLQFGNGRDCLVLMEADTFAPYCRCFINLPHEAMDDDEAAINHDLSAALTDALVKAGLIDKPHRSVKPAGSFMDFAICRYHKL
jgi:hypothetical protein